MNTKKTTSLKQLVIKRKTTSERCVGGSRVDIKSDPT